MDVFELFEPKLKELVKKQFEKPTKIQDLVIPKILAGKNTLVISETGTGKTESVLLPIFNNLIKKEHKQIAILYLTPLKSLNRDLLKRILFWSRELGFDVSVRHGDTSQYERNMQAQNPFEMLISTPETLQAILVGKVMREHLKNIKYIIIDEIHELINSKRGVQLSVGLERLKELIKSSGNDTIQLIGLSATVGNPKTVAKFLSPNKPCEIINAASIKKINLKIISPKPKKEDNRLASDLFIQPETLARIKKIKHLIEEKKPVLVFSNTRVGAEILSSRLKTLYPEMKIEAHHSSLSKTVRIKTEDDFKNGELSALVCTSSLELGIDIGNINYIIQYQSPRQVSKLIQRVGRSGHKADLISNGIIIVSDIDDCFESTVIVKNALLGKIENSKVYSKSLDVLAHQIIGLCLEEYNIPAKKVYDIIKKALPYSDLTEKEFLEICMFMQKLGYIWLNEDSGVKFLRRSKRAWKYYFENLSTIPDTKNYQIIDIVSQQKIGSLDAEFIALHGTPGLVFICKGEAWKILEINNDKSNKIFVEPAKSIEAAIPSWEGELIPIPFDIAVEVKNLRNKIAEINDATSYLLNNYPISKNVAEVLVNSIKKQKSISLPKYNQKCKDVSCHNITGEIRKHGIDSNNEITIEYNFIDDFVFFIIHSCFGSMVNETIGRILAILFMNKFGSVGLKTDAYRIILNLERNKYEEALNLFKDLQPELIKTLKLALPNTELFRFRFIHVAKRFGIIAKDADFGKGYLSKIIDLYKNTPAHRETINELLQEKFDLEKAEMILKKIKNGEIKFNFKQGFSTLGKAGLEARYEIVAQEKPEKEILNLLENRLLNTKVRLLCCVCGWGINYVVKNLPENIKCLSCGAKLLTVISPHDTDKEALLKKFLRKRKLLKKEKEIVNNMLDAASLVISSGKKAVFVLAGRGIGAHVGARILSFNRDGDELLKQILKAERTFVRTKSFWK